MASGLKVESSNSPNLKLEEKGVKTVTFNEPKKSNGNNKTKNVPNKHMVKPRGENRNPKRFFSRQEGLGKFNEIVHYKAGKRRYSYSSTNDFKSGSKRRRQGEKIILPTKFLLGGNINDPLNLGSLQDEEVNRRLNAVTPQSSPLPTPKHHLQVEVLIPPNIHDPLSLNDENQDLELCLLSPNKVGKKKKKRNRPKNVGDVSPVKIPKLSDDALKTASSVRDDEKSASGVNVKQSDSRLEKLQLNIKKKNDEKIHDQIVSPVVPQGQPIKNRKRSSFSRSTSREGADGEKHEKYKRRTGKRRHSSGASNTSVGNISNQVHFRAKDAEFQYGNYNRYYGYRNQNQKSDPRLKCLKKEWIEGNYF